MLARASILDPGLLGREKKAPHVAARNGPSGLGRRGYGSPHDVLRRTCMRVLLALVSLSSSRLLIVVVEHYLFRRRLVTVSQQSPEV